MIETGMCDYRTPCGWCSKWDKKCDKKIGIFVKPEEIKSVDGLTSATCYCRNCESGTGIESASYPIKCNITGRYHTINDTCDLTLKKIIDTAQKSELNKV